MTVKRKRKHLDTLIGTGDAFDPAVLSGHTHKPKRPKRIAFSKSSPALFRSGSKTPAAAVQEFLDTMVRVRRIMSMHCEGAGTDVRADGTCGFCGQSVSTDRRGVSLPHPWDGSGQ